MKRANDDKAGGGKDSKNAKTEREPLIPLYDNIHAISCCNELRSMKYEIRGPLAYRAEELELQGHNVLKCNIGNPGAFGFEAPQVVLDAIKENVGRAVPYEHQKGLPEARAVLLDKYRKVRVCVLCEWGPRGGGRGWGRVG